MRRSKFARASELGNNQMFFVKIKIIQLGGQQEKLVKKVLANFSQFGVFDVILDADSK